MSWQPISNAPRDGTVIWIRCTFGVRPYVKLASFRNLPPPYEGGPFWCEVNSPIFFNPDVEYSMSWKPFDRDAVKPPK